MIKNNFFIVALYKYSTLLQCSDKHISMKFHSNFIIIIIQSNKSNEKLIKT